MREVGQWKAGERLFWEEELEEIKLSKQWEVRVPGVLGTESLD